MVISDGQLLLVRFAGILHLGDSNSSGKAVAARTVGQLIVHVEFRVVHTSENCVTIESIGNQEVLIDMRQHLCLLDVRRIDFRMSRVVLGQVNYLFTSDAWNES